MIRSFNLEICVIDRLMIASFNTEIIHRGYFFLRGGDLSGRCSPVCKAIKIQNSCKCVCVRGGGKVLDIIMYIKYHQNLI